MIAGCKDESRVKVLTAAVLAALVAIAMTTLAVGKAYAEGTIDKAGDYSVEYYDDGDGPSSIWLTGYLGSETQVIVPTKMTTEKTGVELPGKVGEFELMGTFAENANVTKIAVPNGVSYVGPDAFKNCSALEEVAFGNDLAGFFGNAFAGCENLKTYRIGGTSIADISLINCSGIGQDPDGGIYPDVTVYTVKGSLVDTYIQQVNADAKAKDPNANQIALVYEDNPFANHTVKPTQSSTGDNGSGTNDNGSGTGGDNGGANDNGSGDNDDKPLTIDPTKQMGKDGTAYGEGAAAEATEAALTKYAKETDPKGTVFGLLQAKVKKVTKTAITLNWKKPAGATRFAVFGNKCGSKNKQVKLTTTTKTTLKFNKKLKKGIAIKKGTYYKFTIVALNKKGQVVATSKIIHVATPGGKWTNDKAVTTAAKKNAVTLKKGKSFKLKAKAVPIDKSMKRGKHRTLSYESSKKTIATVDKKGIIKAKKKGTCYVYAYAQNGVCAKIKVTVK